MRQYSATRGSAEKKGVGSAKKKTEREAKKAHLAAEKLATQINKNPPGGVQKIRKYY